MRKIINILGLNLLLISSAFAETKEEKRAKYILLNMHQDYIACYSFYKIGAEYVRKSNGNAEIIEGIEKSSEHSLKLAHDTGDMLGMTSDEMSTMVKSEIKNQLDLIDNDFNNASVLLEKFSQMCKKIVEDKKQRISFWEEQAKKKFNE